MKTDKPQVLASCARCNRLFTRINYAVCPTCQEVERADFDKIRDILAQNPGLTLEQLAEQAGVSAACVMRMIETGIARMETINELDPPICGMCGAPAISYSKRICESCLNRLDSQVASILCNTRLGKKKPFKSTISGVHAAVRKKRKGE